MKTYINTNTSEVTRRLRYQNIRASQKQAVQVTQAGGNTQIVKTNTRHLQPKKVIHDQPTFQEVARRITQRVIDYNTAQS